MKQMMKSGNFLEELKEFFQTTPKDVILNEWAKTEEFDEIKPTVEDFISSSEVHYKIHLDNPIDSGVHFSNNNLSPEFSSGFLFLKNSNSNAKSSILN